MKTLGQCLQRLARTSRTATGEDQRLACRRQQLQRRVDVCGSRRRGLGQVAWTQIETLGRHLEHIKGDFDVHWTWTCTAEQCEGTGQHFRQLLRPLQGMAEGADTGDYRTLIGHFVQAMGWTPIKAHHWPDEGRVQFKPGDAAQEIDAPTVQHGISQWIEHDLPRLTSLREGAREIGFGELPAYGCGGTHVRSLKDLGTVTIASLSQKKGTLSVHYSVD